MRWISSGVAGLLLGAVIVAVGCGSSSKIEPRPHGASGSSSGESGFASGGEAGGSDGASTSGAGGAVSSEAGAGGAAGEVAQPVPLDGLLDAIVNAICTLSERCGEPNEWADLPGGCRAALAQSEENGVLLHPLHTSYAEFMAALEKGNAAYDPAAMGACVLAFRTRSCNDFSTPAACLVALNGLLAPESACELDIECAGPGACIGCPGHCVAGRGGLCAGPPCDKGMVCGGRGVCVSVSQPGEPCGNSGVECEGMAFCDEDASGDTGICRALELAPLGSSCDPQHGVYCEAGVHCIYDFGDSTIEQCVAVSPSGGPCQVWLYDQTCPVGEYCEPGDGPPPLTGTCRPWPKAGEPCGPLGCGPAARCSLDDVCVKLVALGGDCHADADCFSGDCADGACAIRNGCSVDDPDKLSCPLVTPGGKLIEGFDDEASLDAWLAYDRPGDGTSGIAHDLEGRACPGSLRLDIPEPTFSGSTVALLAGISLPFAQDAAVHLSLKLRTPDMTGVGNFDPLQVGTTAKMPDGTYGSVVVLGDLAMLADGEWHQFSVPLGATGATLIGVDVEVAALAEAPEDGPSAPPPVSLLVDDIWLEE